jgi:geranylgeranyl pyrophosphate synthase
MDFDAEMKRRAVRVEEGIDRLLPAANQRPERLAQAMRYSMQAGGKRLRPVLVLSASELWAGRPQPGGPLDPLPAAVAVECIHTYSLIHDDLPCMDNDDLRRGRPTLHKATDEATALLAGDALLAFAFQLLGTHYASRPAVAAALCRELGTAAGFNDLVGGQMLDLQYEKSTSVTPALLEEIHRRKTGGLIAASLVLGGLIGGADPSEAEILRRAGFNLGLAFQIVDDVLDATADSATLGKTAGKDAKADKTTYVKLHGLEASRRQVREKTDSVLADLRRLPGDTTFLAGLAEWLASRSK